MYTTIKNALQEELEAIRAEGLYKEERIITTPQGAEIQTTNTANVLNFCANNYLGLSAHPEVINAGKEAIDTHGYGYLRFVLFVVPRISIRNWNERPPNF